MNRARDILGKRKAKVVVSQCFDHFDTWVATSILGIPFLLDLLHYIQSGDPISLEWALIFDFSPGGWLFLDGLAPLSCEHL